MRTDPSMKRFRNERHGFEILVPMDWFPVIGPMGSPFGEALLFSCGPDETFNIIVGIEVPELGLDQTENHFYKYAEERGYSGIKVGRITAGGKEHVCAICIQPGNVWTKKYMIVFDETEYAITASCFRQESYITYEEKWDSIVRSFAIFRHKKPAPTNEGERILNAAIYFECGHGLFNAGKYKEAIEQFEKGQLLGNILPGNYFGVAATIMQMLEKDLIPKKDIKDQLLLAEKNIKECLRISPNEQDYKDVHQIIIEKKKNM